jgi:mono/diheme cytochrome c family protein
MEGPGKLITGGRWSAGLGVILAGGVVLSVTACSKEGRQQGGGETTGAAPPPAAAPAPSPGNITPRMIALGDSIFHGQAANGLCYTCHGANAKGTQLAPDLTDKTWLNGDGSYQFIVNTVTQGVPKPKQHAAPMPPMGGSQLTQEQIRAVAAYVYSLSHPEVRRGS